MNHFVYFYLKIYFCNFFDIRNDKQIFLLLFIYITPFHSQGIKSFLSKLIPGHASPSNINMYIIRVYYV
jgi:hypothetical protein